MIEAAGSLAIDTALVPTLFARSRLRAADDFLQREVAKRMRERLVNIRVDAAQVVDLGCGPGRDFAWLRERLPDATICGVDVTPARLNDAHERRRTGLARFLRRDTGPLRVAADFETLPFAARTFDLLWSNLALHWSNAPHRVLPEWARVARVGGLVVFSAFGPDTLREVGEAFAGVDRARHVMPFTDMHDYGDMLVASGFTTPVVDMERLTLTYSTVESVWRDVRALGGNAAIDRPRGMHGRDWGRRVVEALARTRGPDGRYRLTFELVFAHAWKGEPRTTSRGETIVRLERPR